MTQSAPVLLAIFTIEAGLNVISTSPADGCIIRSELNAVSSEMLPGLPDPFSRCTAE